jgi:hypothetical protein
MLPGSGGSAIGAVSLASCIVSEDQRGLPRPAAGKSSCDIGAVETPFAGESAPPVEAVGVRKRQLPSFHSRRWPHSSAAPKPLQFKKGFVRKSIKSKPTCVKAKHPRHHHP